MIDICFSARTRTVTIRTLFLAGTALGGAATANAQNIVYNGPGDYTLTTTATISGGPRTVDVTVNSGNILLDLATVSVVNNGGTLGAGVAASNTGPGNVSVATDQINASGTGQIYGIDARSIGGNIVIDSLVVNANNNPTSRGIYAISAGGNITITSVEANGGQRGIFTGSNQNVFPNIVTINSGTATANGTNQPNAIVGQGQTVSITSGTASLTNAAGNNGAAIFANAGTGGATISSGTATAAGTNQAVIQAYSDGAVKLTSDVARGTQGSDVLSVQSGTVIAIKSNTITTAGTNGRGIIVGGYNNPANLTYTSLAIDSGAITTSGQNGYGIYITPTTGTTAITSGTINTSGVGAHGIYITDRGLGGLTGAITIASGTIATTGAGGNGIFLENVGGRVAINATNVTTAAANTPAIFVKPVSGSASTTAITAGIVRTTGANSSGIVVAAGGASSAVTASEVYATGVAIDSRAVGAASIDVGITRATGTSTGLVAISTGGTATIASRDAQVNGSTGIFAQGLHDATVTSGVLKVTGAGQTGIFAQNDGNLQPGIVTVNSTTLTSDGGGINAFAPGGTVVVNSGTLTSGGTATGIGAFAVDTNVTSQTLVSGGNGIFASFGNNATTFGTATVNSGSIEVRGTDTGTTTALIANGANVNVTSGTITNSGTGNRLGISAQTLGGIANPGNVAVNTGSITTVGNGAYGVQALVNSGTGSINVTNTGTITTSGTVRPAGTQTRYSAGIIAASAAGPITIASNNIATSGAQSAGIRVEASDGITAFSFQQAPGTAPVSVTSTGAIGTSGANAEGIRVQSGQSAATIANSGTIATSGAGSAGIYALGTTGALAITNSGSVTTAGLASAAINASTQGSVNVAGGTAGAANGNAILVNAGTTATVSATSASAAGDGFAGVSATGGTGVSLDIANATSTGSSVNGRADAVYAIATNGAVNARIGSASATGVDANGVYLLADGTGGAVTATITGTVTSAQATGLLIDPPGSVNLTVASGARVSGALAGIDTIGGTNTITNLGTVSSSNGPAVIAIGATTLDNSGTLSGANNVAVRLDTTNDAVILRTGSAVTGRIVGGGGTDSATLIGTGTAATPTQTIAGFDGFSTLAVQSGTWTATTAAPSTFASSVTIASGATLDAQNGPAGLVIAAPSIVDNGTLVVRSSATSGGSTFGSSVVSGSGPVLLTGPGTVLLDGTNSLANTGTITIDGDSLALITGTQGGNVVTGTTGTLQVGNGGTTGAFTGTLADNGTLIVNRANDYTFSGGVSGAGLIVKQGAGKLTFGTNFAFTGTTRIDAGSIKLSQPVSPTTEIALEGSGTLDLSGFAQVIAELAGTSTAAKINIDAGSLTVNQATNTSFAGSIIGNGSLTKSGSGTLNLTGTSTYAGPTTINGGILAVNGSITSPVNVVSGGTLGGTGTVGTVTVTSGGVFAPGNSIGTMTVNGNLAFGTGSTFRVEANAAGQADRVNATGTATLSGGTVQVLAAAGTYNTRTDYTILTAAGGVTGQFAGATSNMAFLTPLLGYSPNTVTLTLARNDVSFAALAGSTNQIAVANAINARGVNDRLFNAVLFASGPTAQATFDQLSGEFYPSLTTEVIDTTRRIRDAVLDRTRIGEGTGIWIEGLKSNSHSASNSIYSKIGGDRRGVVGGIDLGYGGARFGVFGAYQDDDVSSKRLGDSAKIKTTLVGANAAFMAGPLEAQIGASYAWHKIDTARTVTVPGLAATYTGRPDGTSVELFGELGYRMAMGNYAFTPFVRDAYTRTRLDTITEVGGVNALTIDTETRKVNLASLGLRFDGDQAFGSNGRILPRMSVAYQYASGDRNPTAAAQIGGIGPIYTITGAPMARSGFDVEGGFDLLFANRFSIGAGGFASTSKQWSDYGGKVSVGLRF
jgi:fibronectin-binding autotransporter adhesin